jgi:hypothetical protein
MKLWSETFDAPEAEGLELELDEQPSEPRAAAARAATRSTDCRSESFTGFECDPRRTD